jgi:hypothetical protein
MNVPTIPSFVNAFRFTSSLLRRRPFTAPTAAKEPRSFSPFVLRLLRYSVCEALPSRQNQNTNFAPIWICRESRRVLVITP